ncbi:alpha/beta fold hydrolase [Cognatishimia sp. F0-27]|uniref:alpha/beta fold hydrolase n=1 Tax=Cognatishimia sp. F0-27 TaxID=2816855 RepID=UPI001D0C3BE4|nr:alpha/beta hydrolase [Cognatishimia sp. F0-27]MCC1491902.1 alpha/beta hydrolase [Cognatishimia sp. F0-27]
MTHFFTPDALRIAYDVTGSGPPVLLLHGFPQNRHMWTRIAPQMAASHTAVTADLRGYGDSDKPDTVDAMSFRSMGRDMLALMEQLGFGRFHLVGHDRGARTAHRMALDAPERVASLTLMDIIPTHRLLADLTASVARSYYHWFFLAQPAPFPETLIAHDPDAYFERCLLGFGKATLADFDPAMLARYRTHWRNPACIHAMCNDYRAAIDIDFAMDAADLERRISCPALVAYGAEGAMAQAMDVAATWRDRLDNMTARSISGGHFFPDQSPQETVAQLRAFLAPLSL